MNPTTQQTSPTELTFCTRCLAKTRSAGNHRTKMTRSKACCRVCARRTLTPLPHFTQGFRRISEPLTIELHFAVIVHKNHVNTPLSWVLSICTYCLVSVVIHGLLEISKVSSTDICHCCFRRKLEFEKFYQHLAEDLGEVCSCINWAEC